jgi:alginate O-acetyltransferase complex protein AlgI
MTMLSGMAGLNGAALPTMVGATTGLNLKDAMIWLPLGLVVVWFVPNTQTWLAKFSPAWDNVTKSYSCGWQPNRRHAVFIGAILGIDLLCLNRVSEFLYFQF